MSYLKALITPDFWFNMYPPPLVKPAFIVLGVLIAALFVGGVIIKWVGYKKRSNPPLHRVLSRVGRFAIGIALAAAFLYFLDYEQIPYVSARFWWLLLAVGAIVWKVFIILDIFKRYPAEKRVLAERLAREKYLPK